MFGLKNIIFKKKETKKGSLIKLLLSDPDQFKYEIEVIDEKIVLTMTKKEAE